jgi:hypothetical protein
MINERNPNALVLASTMVLNMYSWDSDCKEICPDPRYFFRKSEDIAPAYHAAIERNVAPLSSYWRQPKPQKEKTGGAAENGETLVATAAEVVQLIHASIHIKAAEPAAQPHAAAANSSTAVRDWVSTVPGDLVINLATLLRKQEGVGAHPYQSLLTKPTGSKQNSNSSANHSINKLLAREGQDSIGSVGNSNPDVHSLSTAIRATPFHGDFATTIPLPVHISAAYVERCCHAFDASDSRLVNLQSDYMFWHVKYDGRMNAIIIKCSVGPLFLLLLVHMP